MTACSQRKVRPRPQASSENRGCLSLDSRMWPFQTRVLISLKMSRKMAVTKCTHLRDESRNQIKRVSPIGDLYLALVAYPQILKLFQHRKGREDAADALAELADLSRLDVAEKCSGACEVLDSLGNQAHDPRAG